MREIPKAERVDASQKRLEQAENRDSGSKLNIALFRSMARVMALATVIGVAAGANCTPDTNPSNRPDTNLPSDPETSNKGPFENYYMQSLNRADQTGCAGVRLDYVLSENVQDARVEVIDKNGNIIHSQSYNLPEGRGNITFIEPDVNGPNTDQFAGAGDTEKVIISGRDATGKEFQIASDFTIQ